MKVVLIILLLLDDEEITEEDKKLFGKVGEGDEEYYNENLDDEDEIWVKKHLSINLYYREK